MVTRLDWRTSFRIIPSRYPEVALFEDVAAPADRAIVLELEAATNPRVHQRRDPDPVSAAFAHPRLSRFSDGTFGVYYAAGDEVTAIAETAYHRARFLKEAGFPDERLDMRVYTASIAGNFDDVRAKTDRSKLYDPFSYAYSSRYARKLAQRNAVDGIVYRSVRHANGQCAAAFNPAAVSNCRTLHHLQYRFEGFELSAVYEISLRTPRT